MPVTECIAVYIRLSSEDNDVDGSIKAESNSVSAQRMLINEFIKKQDEFTNCPVVEYVDDGYSGTNFNRPGFQRMVEDAKAGRIKSIVIKDDCVIIEPTQKDLENQGFVAGSICF